MLRFATRTGPVVAGGAAAAGGGNDDRADGVGDQPADPAFRQRRQDPPRILPQSVSDVVDVLAIGEPIGLESLRRITDAEAVEEAETRGLINLNKVDGRVEVRVAHPLYGEVRRKRSPSTRIRRLRGLVAAELAASEDRDDVRVVVRRAALSLDSDLEPDAGLLVSAARGAVWLRDLALADRLADAAVRAGGGPESSFIRAYVLSSLSRGEEADAVLANVVASDLTDIDRARLTWLEARRHPGWRYLDHELAVAQAWLSASQGAVSEAVRATLSAAQTARANGQFAAEVMCLQTATQFGDSSSAGRLHQLCQIVEGPRARLAARFADAMQAGNARNSPLYQRLSSRWAI